MQRDPHDPRLAARLGWRYLELGRRHGASRFYAYARQPIGGWWEAEAPPHPLLLPRAVLLQRDHRFAAALADVERLLEADPRHAQAWLTRCRIRSPRWLSLNTCPIATIQAKRAGFALGHHEM